MKRTLSVIILLVFLVPFSVSYASGSYSSEISSVMLNFSLNNYSCKSAPQQAVNGNYRTVEMLEIIAKELDN